MELYILGGLVIAAQMTSLSTKFSRPKFKPINNIYRIYYPNELIASEAREAYTLEGAKKIAFTEFPRSGTIRNNYSVFDYGKLNEAERFALSIRPQMAPVEYVV